MTVYYAHPMAIYGTPQEDRDIETLENLGFTVVNPNTFDIADQCRDIRRRFGVDASSVMMLTMPSAQIRKAASCP